MNIDENSLSHCNECIQSADYKRRDMQDIEQIQTVNCDDELLFDENLNIVDNKKSISSTTARVKTFMMEKGFVSAKAFLTSQKMTKRSKFFNYEEDFLEAFDTNTEVKCIY